MIVALATVALALALPVEGLESAAARAERVVEACASGDCGVTREQLAEAFVVQAAAAAVFRGELDATSVANAEHLDPAVITRWAAVLPSTIGAVPDPWVLDLGQPAPPRVEPRPARPPGDVSRGLAFQPGPTAVTAMSTVRAGSDGWGWGWTWTGACLSATPSRCGSVLEAARGHATMCAWPTPTRGSGWGHGGSDPAERSLGR
ncbi:MAG: hypothetical protein ACI8PZ_000932 [Myxococcota bacterium]